MGAWGAGNFENDGALDWLLEFETHGDARMLAHTLRTVIDAGDEYVDVDDATAALVASEIVAAVNGHAAAKLPSEVAAHVASLGLKPDAERTKLAVKAVQRVQTNSELQDLWKGNRKWRAVVLELLERLAMRPRAVAKSKKHPRKKAVSVREVASFPSPDGTWVFGVSEVSSPAGASTQAAVSYPGGGAGVWAAMGTSLGVSARWVGARRLEINVPKGAKEFQRETRIQDFSEVLKISYRTF